MTDGATHRPLRTWRPRRRSWPSGSTGPRPPSRLGVTVAQGAHDDPRPRAGRRRARTPGTGQRVPADFLQDGLVVKGLPGLLTVLHDGGYDDRQCIAWIFTDADLPGRPIDALRENRGARSSAAPRRWPSDGPTAGDPAPARVGAVKSTRVLLLVTARPGGRVWGPGLWARRHVRPGLVGAPTDRGPRGCPGGGGPAAGGGRDPDLIDAGGPSPTTRTGRLREPRGLLPDEDAATTASTPWTRRARPTAAPAGS